MFRNYYSQKYREFETMISIHFKTRIFHRYETDTTANNSFLIPSSSTYLFMLFFHPTVAFSRTAPVPAIRYSHLFARPIS